MTGAPVHFAGIDPGVTGALALLDPQGRALSVHDAPVNRLATSTKTKSGNPKTRADYDLAAFATLIRSLPSPCIFSIELVHPRPGSHREGDAGDEKLHGQTHAPIAAFRMGESLMAWRATLVACGRGEPITLQPSYWRRQVFDGAHDVLGVDPWEVDRGKDGSLTLARALFPTAASLLTRKKDQNRAEALLIACAARRLAAAGKLGRRTP